MDKILLFILISTIFSFIISFPIIKLLYKYKIIRNGEYDDTYKEIPERSKKAGVPLMGGTIIIITILVINIFFNLSRSHTLLPLAVLSMCAIIGALDDILNIFGRTRGVKKLRHIIMLSLHHAKPMKRVYYAILIPWTAYKSLFYSFGSRLGKGLHPHEKVLVQCIAGAVIAYWIYFKLHWTDLWIPGGTYINLGFLIIPFIIFLVVLMANAVNVTDGMDGLSAGLLISCFTTFMILSFILKNTQISILCATAIGGLISYLYFNIKPARIEMGDIGSLALGGMLATIAILLHREILLLIVGLIFIIEIFSVVLQKLFKKFFDKKLFLMTPIHHHFELLGWSEEKVVMRFWLFSIILTVFTLYISLI